MRDVLSCACIYAQLECGGTLASAPAKFEAFMHGATEWTSGPQVVGHRSIVGMSSGGVSMQVRLSSMMCCKSNEPSNSVASVFRFWFRLDRLENPAWPISELVRRSYSQASIFSKGFALLHLILSQWKLGKGNYRSPRKQDKRHV
jgi:hypothetical protein